jgi:hypothetical protein
MTRAVAAAVLVAAFVAPVADAKGLIDASLVGPGLERPIELAEPSSGLALGLLGRAAGLHQATWGGRLPSRAPTNDLGPKYTLTYRLGPHGTDGTVVQDVYPYARPEAVTYTAPGQWFYAMRTRGGWHVRTSRRARPLLSILVEAGLPPRPPTRSGTASAPWSVVEWSALGGALLLGAVVAGLMRRRAATTASAV